MAEAAYAAGPALLGASRLLSSIPPPRVFCSLFHRGAQQCASAEPQRAQVPRSQKAGPQTVFFVPCFIVSARGPKEPKVRKKRQAPKFKNRGPKERGPKRFLFPVSTRDPNSVRTQRVQTNFSVPSLGKGLQKARP